MIARRKALIGCGVVAVLLAESICLAPYVVRALHELARVRVSWLLLALFAETASMMSFARLHRLILVDGGVRVRLRAAVSSVFAGTR